MTDDGRRQLAVVLFDGFELPVSLIDTDPPPRRTTTHRVAPVGEACAITNRTGALPTLCRRAA
ncbi:MAG: hypothetical protein ACYDGN_01630 [Acidimicrobiales bacterium]